MRFYLLLSLFMVAFPLIAANPKITFIVPDREGGLFWQLVSDVGKAAALNLKVDLEIISTDSNRFALKKAIDDITTKKDKPDYLIFRPFDGNTEAVFCQLESAKIRFITLEQSFTGDIQKILGQPQQKFKYWLGQLNYDNKAGGKLLVDAMIAAHFKQSPDETMYIAGIGGDFDKVSKDRQLILEEIRSQNTSNNVVVNQIFPMNWDPKLIQQRFPLIKVRYPNTNAYWCAGDRMAIEVLLMHQKDSRTPVIIGGFDWLPIVLNKVKTGEITASVGGHFLMLAISLVQILDYENGIDTFLTPPLLKNYELITRDNVKQHLTFFEEKLWTQIDFSKYLISKQKKPGLTLTVKNLLAELNMKEIE
jgi:ABC-type sugar transport system substrate-binding protein